MTVLEVPIPWFRDSHDCLVWAGASQVATLPLLDIVG